MAQPVKKYFGNFDLEQLTEAIKAIKANGEVGEYKGKEQVKIGAAQWEDGGISIDVWVKGIKKSFKVGNLRVSTLDNNQSFNSNQAPQQVEGDLPF